MTRLDGREDEIRHFLKFGVSKSSIAKITGVTRTTLYTFIATRGHRHTRASPHAGLAPAVSVYSCTNLVSSLLLEARKAAKYEAPELHHLTGHSIPLAGKPLTRA